jgi:hypothetical protein
MRKILLLLAIILTAGLVNAQIISDFESDEQGWFDNGWGAGLTGVAQAADPSGESGGVLAIGYDIGADKKGVIQKDGIDPAGAQLLTYYIWLPADFPDGVDLKIWAQDNASWAWVDAAYPVYKSQAIPKEVWFPLNMDMIGGSRLDAADGYDLEANMIGKGGVEFGAWNVAGDDTAWSGTVYIDNVSLVGADPLSVSDFESDEQGWFDNGWGAGLTSVAQAVDPSGESGGVLAIGYDIGADKKGVIQKDGIDPASQQILTYMVWLPADFPDGVDLKIWAQDNASWAWVDAAYPVYKSQAIPKEVWFPLNMDMIGGSRLDAADGYDLEANMIGKGGVEFGAWNVAGDDTAWSGTVYIDNVVLSGSEVGDNWVVVDFETVAGGTGGFTSSGWAPATASLNWAADPTSESEGVLEHGLDFTTGGDPKAYISREGVNMYSEAADKTADKLSLDVWIPDGFPANAQFGLVIRGGADISGTGWLEYVFFLGTDSTDGMQTNQWNTMEIDIAAEADAGNIDPMQVAGLGMQLYIADETSYVGTIYFDNLTLHGIPAPEGTLTPPSLIAEVASTEADNGNMVNTVKFDWVDNTLGTESYNIYMSADPITDLSADGVIKIHSGIPHGLQSYAHRPWTRDGAVGDYYYAITAEDAGVETELGDESAVGPISIETSVTMKAVYVADFADAFTLDGLATEFEPYLEYQITPETAGGDEEEGWTEESTDLYFKTTFVIDDDYLYISADVTDDDLRTDEAMQAWEGDALEFYMGFYDAYDIDAWHGKNYNNSNGDWRIGFTARGEVALEAGTGSPDGIPGVEATVFQKFTGDGYIIEARLNLDSLVAEGEDFVVYDGMMLPCRIDNNDYDPTMGDEGRSLILQVGGTVAPEGVDMNEDWKRPHAWGFLEVLGSPTGTDEEISGLPKEFRLYRNYPNPFNPNTTIKYDIAKDSDVKIKVFDILGREITTLVNSSHKPGRYEVNFNAGNLASGVYIYSITAGTFKKTQKMMLMK